MRFLRKENVEKKLKIFESYEMKRLSIGLDR
jgi:hypothetical protein